MNLFKMMEKASLLRQMMAKSTLSSPNDMQNTGKSFGKDKVHY